MKSLNLPIPITRALLSARVLTGLCLLAISAVLNFDFSRYNGAQKKSIRDLKAALD
jgi:hypothetical protein